MNTPSSGHRSFWWEKDKPRKKRDRPGWRMYRKRPVWGAVFALLLSAFFWPKVARSSACSEAQELFLLGVGLGQPCAGECLEKKVALYVKAAELCPQYPEAYNNLADAYEKLGLFDKAGCTTVKH